MDFEKDVIRTVTFKLIPALVILYLVAYIDRAAVGFAHLHMGADVGIGDAAYGLGAGLFFIGYFLFEVPSNLLLDKFGARKWFTRILLTWGLITMAMALIQGPKSFYLLRFLLGVAEAGFFPWCFIPNYAVVSGAASRKNHGNVCAFTTNCHDDCRAFSWSITWNGWHCKFTRLAMVVCCSWLARGFIGFTYLFVAAR
ncbi:major Facilitator Superfamily protein [Acinetobacter baumannii 25561_10]|nr:major Facilitator Superfamily protein [Acinetobacter baumannii 24860_2]EXH76339.1 major Facilitator Superfamily protein [Acinetobacter baumannii 23671]EXW30085.1 major Facilitator Superfamily protein [Acinetobacter baumannii 25561_10]EYD10644.1 major Facilitator Superfamily protein [Acinetobacter baumannii 44362_2]